MATQYFDTLAEMGRNKGPSPLTLIAGRSFYWRRVNSLSWGSGRPESWAAIADWANSDFAQSVVSGVRRRPGRGPWTRSQVRRAALVFADHHHLPPPGEKGTQ